MVESGWQASDGDVAAIVAAGPAANLLLVQPADAVATPQPAVTTAPPLSPAMMATFLFVCASAMIWSYVGAGATVTGFSNRTLGLGVALGSMAAGGAALTVAHATPRLPVVAAATLAGLGMATPFLVGANAIAFLAAMVAFNVGATYAVARFSALAIERQDGTRGLLPAVQSLAMAFGPLMGAVTVARGGFVALGIASALILLAAVMAVVVDGRQRAIGIGMADGTMFHDDFETTEIQALTQT